jgi:cbb3-type cytochrome oxidase subunit 3
LQLTRHFTNPIGLILFWCLFMHALWFAFRVEQERRKPRADVAVFE